MRHVNSLRVGLASLALVASSAGMVEVSPQDRSLPFSCATFSPGVGAADLRARFGEENVQTAPVPWGGGEGDFNEGTASVFLRPSGDAGAESVGLRGVSSVPMIAAERLRGR